MADSDSQQLTVQDVMSMNLDFSTFLAMFSVIVIFYYVIKIIKRKAAVRDDSKTTYLSPVKQQKEHVAPTVASPIPKTPSPKKAKTPVKNKTPAKETEDEKPEIPIDPITATISRTQAKKRRNSYGLVDHSTTIKKKPLRGKPQLYCPMNVPSALASQSSGSSSSD
jgi:hypothetical protein